MGFEENKRGWRSRVFAAAFAALALLVTLPAITRLYIRTRRLGQPPACLAPPRSAADLDEDSEPSPGEPPPVRNPACRRAAVRYYILRLRDEDPETRRRAAEALANLGDLSALPHLIRSMPFGDLALEPAFSNLRRGAKLSASFFSDDPAALAVLEFGERGAAALPWTLSQLKGRSRGPAILLAATAGLGDVSPSVAEVLKEIALSDDEEGAVPAIAILALGTMGEAGADALAELVEAGKARGEIRERLNQGESPGLPVELCLETRLRAMSADSPDAAAL